MKVSGPVRAAGAWSDSALNRVTAALVETDGETIFGFGETVARPYTAQDRATIRAALGRWPGEPGVAEAAGVVEAAHAGLLAGFDAAALIGFTGHRIAHEPGGRGSHWAGDGQRLAEGLGRPVVWDFHSADIALGGQGAPLVPVFHFALARHIGAEAPLAVLHVGGTATLSLVDPRHARPEDPGALLAFDTGPGLAPLLALAAARPGLTPEDAVVRAAEGDFDAGIVTAFLRDPFFYRVPPKALAPDAFAGLATAVRHLPDADAAATLAACSVAAVARALEHCPAPPARLLVTGPGRRSEAIMAGLAATLDFAVAPVEAEGLDGDALMAQAIAFLAVRVARGLPTSFPATTGVAASVGGGIVSTPA